MIGESCQETEDAYTIRIEIHSGRSRKPSSGSDYCFMKFNFSSVLQFAFFSLVGLKATGIDEQRWPCQSSHHLIVSLDGVKPLTVTLPYPILCDNVQATLCQEFGIIDVIADPPILFGRMSARPLAGSQIELSLLSLFELLLLLFVIC